MTLRIKLDQFSSTCILLFQFVAHPNCQQVLQMDWEQGFKQTGKIYGSRILFLIGRMVSLPFLCLLYLFFPFSSVGRSMRVPSNKYMNFYASYVTFVVFLAAQSELTKRHHDHRGPPNSGNWQGHSKRLPRSHAI